MFLVLAQLSRNLNEWSTSDEIVVRNAGTNVKVYLNLSWLSYYPIR